MRVHLGGFVRAVKVRVVKVWWCVERVPLLSWAGSQDGLLLQRWAGVGMSQYVIFSTVTLQTRTIYTHTHTHRCKHKIQRCYCCYVCDYIKLGTTKKTVKCLGITRYSCGHKHDEIPVSNTFIFVHKAVLNQPTLIWSWCLQLLHNWTGVRYKS